MPVLTKYSMVCQVPGAEPYTVCAYTGVDLTQVLGITQASLSEGTYGWIQELGEAIVNVSGQAHAAYADFRPNAARRRMEGSFVDGSAGGIAQQSSASWGEKFPDSDNLETISQLPPLVIEDGPYCRLIREARDVFVDGHYYACVAMCGISMERFQRDKAVPYGAARKDRIWQIRKLLRKNRAVSSGSLEICAKMADLRNDYAHGDGPNPRDDALRSLNWVHSFIDNETSLMRDCVIHNGILNRKPPAVDGHVAYQAA